MSGIDTRLDVLQRIAIDAGRRIDHSNWAYVPRPVDRFFAWYWQRGRQA